MAQKRCQISFQDGLWQVTFEGVLKQSARSFRTQAQAFMSASEWCGMQRLKGHEVDLRLPTAQPLAS
jgi:hypothetical protein